MGLFTPLPRYHIAHNGGYRQVVLEVRLSASHVNAPEQFPFLLRSNRRWFGVASCVYANTLPTFFVYFFADRVVTLSVKQISRTLACHCETLYAQTA